LFSNTSSFQHHHLLSNQVIVFAETTGILIVSYRFLAKKSPHPRKIIISGYFVVSLTMAREKLNLYYPRISKWIIPPGKNISNNNSNSWRVLFLSLAPFPLEPDVKLNPGHSRSALSSARS
jgi:hypothetical protein